MLPVLAFSLIMLFILTPISYADQPTAFYKLTINTEPPNLCAVYIDGMDEYNRVGDAPVTVDIERGTHTVYLVPVPGGMTLDRWEDGSTGSVREVFVGSDMTITMHLKGMSPWLPGNGDGGDGAQPGLFGTASIFIVAVLALAAVFLIVRKKSAKRAQ